jgi:hypothetical protein
MIIVVGTHCESLGSIPGQSMRDLWWTLALGQVIVRVFRCSPSVSFYQYCILIYMLFLPKGQTSQAWEASKKQCSFENRGALERKVLRSFSFFVLQTVNTVRQDLTTVTVTEFILETRNNFYEHKYQVKLSCYTFYIKL